MSRVKLCYISPKSDISEIYDLFEFCRRLPEYNTKGFEWPKTLMDAGNLEAFRMRLDELYDQHILDDKRVPQETRWIRYENGELIGMAKIRRTLTPELLRHGGHISLGLTPGNRGMGLGTETLALLLEMCAQRGLYDVLLTANVSNFASRRMIEKNGGKLWDIVPVNEGDVMRKLARYWIHLA